MNGTSTSYANRLVDIELLQSASPTANGARLTVGIGNNQPRMVTGLQKAVQRYTVLLLTQLGNNQFNPDEGTDLVTEIAASALRSQTIIPRLFAFANVVVLQQLRNDDKQASFGVMPDDERIDTVTLLDFSVNIATRTVSLRIKLVTMAGLGATYILPAATLQV